MLIKTMWIIFKKLWERKKDGDKIESCIGQTVLKSGAKGCQLEIKVIYSTYRKNRTLPDLKHDRPMPPVKPPKKG